MQNVSLQQAVRMTGKSESTLRRDVKKGKVSAGRDGRRHLRFDISELQRAYGELKSAGDDTQSTEQSNDKAMTGHDRAEILAMKDNQIVDLRNQLEKAESQLQLATTEKTKLLDLLSAEKEEKRELKAEMLALMPRQRKDSRKQPKPKSNHADGFKDCLERDSTIASKKQLAKCSQI